MADNEREPTIQDVLDRLDGIEHLVGHLDMRIGKVETHIDTLCTRVGSLERTVSRKFAAMGAGFGMMRDQLVDDRS